MNNYKEYKTEDVIRFNWDILDKHCDKNASKMLDFFMNVYINKPENYFYLNTWAARIVDDSKSDKQSYIQNIQNLYDNRSVASKDEIYVYLHICSMRSYFSFTNTKCKLNYLPRWKLQGRYNIEQLIMNRLLEIDEKNIILLYELGE